VGLGGDLDQADDAARQVVLVADAVPVVGGSGVPPLCKRNLVLAVGEPGAILLHDLDGLAPTPVQLFHDVVLDAIDVVFGQTMLFVVIPDEGGAGLAVITSHGYSLVGNAVSSDNAVQTYHPFRVAVRVRADFCLSFTFLRYYNTYLAFRQEKQGQKALVACLEALG